MNFAIFQNPLFVGFITFLSGIFATVVTQRILNKRSLLTYFVNHVRVGMSAEDQIFGTVTLKWNGNDIQHLYLSTIELTNRSVRDLENVEVTAYSTDTQLLTEQTEILGTKRTLGWTHEFSEMMKTNSGQATQKQLDLVKKERRFLVPILNRDQTVRIILLNSATSPNQPSIWLDVLHKGVRLKFQVPQNRIYGVEQPKAALSGAIAGLILITIALLFITTNWIIVIFAFALGLFAQLPGVLIIKAWKSIRHIFAN